MFERELGGCSHRHLDELLLLILAQSQPLICLSLWQILKPVILVFLCHMLGGNLIITQTVI